MMFVNYLKTSDNYNITSYITITWYKQQEHRENHLKPWRKPSNLPALNASAMHSIGVYFYLHTENIFFYTEKKLSVAYIMAWQFKSVNNLKKKCFRNLVNPNQIWIVITLFRLIEHQSEFRLTLNLSEFLLRKQIVI